MGQVWDRLCHHGKAFVRSDQAGSVSMETVLVLPLLLWFYVGSFVFFDAYKAYSSNVKAAYTVGDLLSRQTEAVNNTYLDNLTGVFNYMSSQRRNSWLQIAQVRWQASINDYDVEWSRGTNGKDSERLRDSDLHAIRDRLPPMFTGERILIIESFSEYVPAFSVGLSPTITLRNFVVVSPRFAPQLAKE